MSRHWLQYHRPELMGFGVEKLPAHPFFVLTNKAEGNIGDVMWLVGRRAAGPDVYIAFWFEVQRVMKSSNPLFLYEYCGEGAYCDPQPKISSEPWYPALLKCTGNYHFGLTDITASPVLAELHESATNAGSPWPAKSPKGGRCP